MTKAEASGTVKCPHCRQPVPEGSRFCLFCGAPMGSPARVAGGRSLLTLGLLAALIGGLAMAAYGIVSAVGGGGETEDVRPLARADLGDDAREGALDPGDAGTDTISPEDEVLMRGGGGDEPDGGGNPPATGVASPAQALAVAFGLAEGETVVPCSTADTDDTLCYLPYLTNLEQERYLYQLGPPFSEPFAWALVEQRGDGTFETTQTADFDFEGDGTPPFSPGGAMASVTFTSALVDDQPTDRLDDGSNPLPAGATEAHIFVRYTGLQASDEATITLEQDGSPAGEPFAIDIDASGEGHATTRLARHDGAALAAGTYTVSVLLNGATIAQASLAVLP